MEPSNRSGAAPAVAAAPCSFGVFARQGRLPEGRNVLADVRRAGYAGIDLGPVGYLGTVLAELQGFPGWLVVEQDRLLPDRRDWQPAAEAQRRNRVWLAERGW